MRSSSSMYSGHPSFRSNHSCFPCSVKNNPHTVRR
jgi:hypothetical protein